MIPAGLLESGRLDAYRQMGLDEAALEEGAAAPGVLRFYRWSGPSATFGYFQAWAQARSLAAAAGMVSAPLVRRPTGGGLVLHDGDITFSWVFPWPASLTPQALYKDVHRAAHLGFKALGLSTRLWSPPMREAAAGPAPACFPNPAPIDLVSEDGRKLLGGALRKRRGFGLYQGSLRGERLGRGTSELEDALARGIFEGRPPARLEASEATLARAEELARSRYSTRDWNEKR